MPVLSSRHQAIIAAVLLFLLLATRSNHFATLELLPGASWAVFFLAGVYLRPVWALPALLAIVWGIDFAPYLMQGMSVSELLNSGNVFCLSPSYFFLWPAYSSLWLGGQWFAKQHDYGWHSLTTLIVAVVVATAACQIISSGGFYYFSGRFTDPTVAEFALRLLKYFPGYLASLSFYVGAAVIVHKSILALSAAANEPNQSH